jgi:DNA-binding CsgD family transcriptional regulator
MKPLALQDIEVRDLRPREAEALAHAALGYSSKECARLMGISPRTVEFHLDQLMRRLGARNRYELITMAFRDGALRFRNSAAILALCFLMAFTSIADLTSADPNQFVRMQSRILRVRTTGRGNQRKSGAIA